MKNSKVKRPRLLKRKRANYVKPRTVQYITVSLECSRKFHTEIKTQAKKEGRSVSAWIRVKLYKVLHPEA